MQAARLAARTRRIDALRDRLERDRRVQAAAAEAVVLLERRAALQRQIDQTSEAACGGSSTKD